MKRTESPKLFTDGAGLSINHEFRVRGEIHPFQTMPEGIEFLRHLRTEHHWQQTRSMLMRGETVYVPLLGRTASGKRMEASGLLYAADVDPILQAYLAAQGVLLRKVYLPISSALTLAGLTGEIKDPQGHGQHAKEGYRIGSRVQTRYALGEENNYEGPTLVVTESSGLDVFVDEKGNISKENMAAGTDRGFSTVHQLSLNHRYQTRPLVIRRGKGLGKKIMGDRDDFVGATLEQAAAAIKKSYKIYREGKPLDIDQLTEGKLRELIDWLEIGFCPSPGVKRSNREMDETMRKRYGVRRDTELWQIVLGRLGWWDMDYDMVYNSKTAKTFPLHWDLLADCDPMYQKIKLLRASKEGIQIASCA